MNNPFSTSPFLYQKLLLWVPLWLALAVPGDLATSQETSTIQGRIESSITGEALSGVLVTLAGGKKPVRTGTDGRFVLDGVTPGEARITLEFRPNFVTTTELLEIGPGQTVLVSFSMMPVAVLLDELLVLAESGPGGGLLRTYEEEDQALLASKGSVADLLADGFPGVEVRRGSGQVGAGASLRIRGTNSLSLSAEPLVYLDGIRVGGNSGVTWLNAGNVIGILDMIPAETIQSIEILKGPSATRYGIGANNGVILIRTRGRL